MASKREANVLPDVTTKVNMVIQPKNEYFIVWEHFVAFVSLLGISIGFYLATFDSTTMALWFICYFGDFVNFFDMIIMFFVAYVDPKSGAIRDDRRSIVQYRLKTSFIFDLIGLLPLELLAFKFKGISPWRQAAIFHLNRSIRILKTVSIFQNQEADLTHSRMVAAFFKYTVVLVIVIQGFCCVWFREACYGRHEFLDEFLHSVDYFHHNFTDMHCYHESWVGAALLTINANMSNVMDAYIMSLYWTFATVTAVGYGDIVATSTLEMTISFVTMVLGITVFSGLMMGGLTSMLTNADSKRTVYTDQLQVIRATLVEMDVAEDLAKSVVCFYEYIWKERAGFLNDRNELYDSLPHSFQGEICYAINACALKKAPLFENTNEGFMRVLSTKIRQALYLPRQIVVKQGDIGNELFYIRTGAVEILGEDEESVVAVLSSGMVFGEINLIFSTPRTATARAATFCELLILTREEYGHVVTHYPAVDESITAMAKARYREIDEQKMKKAEKKSDPHYKARQPRKTSYVPPSRIRRYSFTQNDRDTEEHHDHPQGIMMDGVELRRLSEKDESNIKEYIGLKKMHEASAPKQTVFALATAVKSVLRFMGNYFMPFWKAFMILVSIMAAIFFPYVACFYYSDYQLPGYYPGTDAGNLWLTVTYMLDICFCVHMMILSHADFSEYSERNRSLTKTTAKLVKEYLMAREFLTSWNFRMNVASVMPLEVLSVLSTSSVEKWRWFGFLRLNRVGQFFLLMRYLKRLEDDIHVSLGKLRSLQMFFYILVFTHWCACALFLVHCQGVNCSNPTWYTVFVSSLPGDIKLVNITQGHKITVALYWAVATLTSTGYGDISAVSVPGMVVAFVSMLIGVLLFGYAVALMAATLANSDSARVRFQSRLFAVKTFMKEQHLSESLQLRINRYLQLMWIKYKGVWMPGDAGLLHDCPAGLLHDIALEDAHKTLSRVPYFMHMEDDFLRDVAIRCHSFYFFPGEDIMHAGDISNELYVIRRGYCQVWSMDMKRKLADLGPGAFFGDQSLLFGDQNHYTVQADTYCDMLVLSTENFNETLELYPDMKEQFDMIRDAEDHFLEVQDRVFDKHKVTLYDENHLTGAHVEEEYTEHVEMETAKDSVVGFSVGNKKMLYNSYVSRRGFVGKLGRCLLFSYALLPEGKLLHYKVHTVTAMAFILSLSIPIQVAFLYDKMTLWFLHIVLDMLFLGNVYLNMHVGFYNKQAVLVTHPLCTSKNYVKKNFIWDLIGSFPFEIFVAARYGKLDSDILHVMAMMRMNRLLSSIKVKLSFNYLESRMDKKTGKLREVEFAIFTVMFINLSTCCMFLTACPPRILITEGSGTLITTAFGYNCFNDSWIVHKGILNESPLKLYVYSAYWATATVVSVGYGDIHAFNWREMRMTIVLMTVGVLFFAYIVASIASAMANADSGRARFQDKLNGIRTLMKDHSVNRKLRNRIVNYYTYLWRRTHGVNPSTLLDGVPHALVSDITYALYSDTIYKISLFTHADHGFVKMLSRCMKPMYFLKSEYIVRKNDVGEEMFFVDRGEVEVCNAQGIKVFATIGTGGAFGEVALLFGCRRTASVKAKTNVDVFCLAKKDLDRVLNLYPEIKKHVMEIGRERRAQASARPLRKREPTEQKPKADTQETKKVEKKKNVFGISPKKYKDDDKKDEEPPPSSEVVDEDVGEDDIRAPDGHLDRDGDPDESIYDTQWEKEMEHVVEEEPEEKKEKNSDERRKSLGKRVSIQDKKKSKEEEPDKPKKERIKTAKKEREKDQEKSSKDDAASTNRTETEKVVEVRTDESPQQKKSKKKMSLARDDDADEGMKKKLPLAKKDSEDDRKKKMSLLQEEVSEDDRKRKRSVAKKDSEDDRKKERSVAKKDSDDRRKKKDSLAQEEDSEDDRKRKRSVAKKDSDDRRKKKDSLAPEEDSEDDRKKERSVAKKGSVDRRKKKDSLAQEEDSEDDRKRKRSVAKKGSVDRRGKKDSLAQEEDSEDDRKKERSVAKKGSVDRRGKKDSLPQEEDSEDDRKKKQSVAKKDSDDRRKKKDSLAQQEDSEDDRKKERSVAKKDSDDRRKKQEEDSELSRKKKKKDEVDVEIDERRKASVPRDSEDGRKKKVLQKEDEDVEVDKKKRTSVSKEEKDSSVGKKKKAPLAEEEESEDDGRTTRAGWEDEKSADDEDDDASDWSDDEDSTVVEEPPPVQRRSTLSAEDLPMETSSDESGGEDEKAKASTWYSQSPDFYYGSDLESDPEEEESSSSSNNNNQNSQNASNKNRNTSNKNRNASNKNRNTSNNKPPEAAELEDQGFIEFLLDPTQIIEPDNENYQKFRLFLELTGTVLAWLTIYQTCFYDFSTFLIAIVYVCDSVNIVDLYIRSRVTYYDDHGILVKDHKMARKAYLLSPKGFFIDLASVFPIEVCCFAFDATSRSFMWSLFRILRLLRVFHVLHFFHDWEMELNVNVLKVRLLKFLFMTLFLTHLVSCLWFALACPMGNCDVHQTSWYVELGDQVGSNKAAWYVSSVYWTMASMTSAGYGDYHAYNLIEMIFSIGVMLTGKMMFGFILGNIASTLANREARMTNYRNTLSGILGRLEDQEVPLHMRKHVVSYLDYTWIRNQGHDFTKLLDDAPQCLAAEVLHEVAKPFFDAMILFKDLEDAFVRRMALNIHRVLYQQGDYIAHKDDLGDEVLFVFRGSVTVLEHDDSDKEHEVGCVGYGTIIGEIFLVHSMPRLMSLRARERTDVLQIEVNACTELLEHYPSSKAIFDSHALEYFEDEGHMSEVLI